MHITFIGKVGGQDESNNHPGNGGQGVVELKAKLDELYKVLPRDDYYRVKQLLSEAEGILEKHDGVTK